MTVQQERQQAPTSPALRLPEQRRGDAQQLQVKEQPKPPVPELRGWGSVEDRTMARRLLLMMVVLSLYASLFVALGARIWD